MPGYDMSKEELLQRLRRIEGQVRGISQMVENERYCIDVLTQITAASRALHGVAVGLLNDHLAHCVVEAAAAGGTEARKKITEATAAIERLVRS